ncbi:hypothetical protein ABFS83_04G192000 [Erythranthe nasuta]
MLCGVIICFLIPVHLGESSEPFWANGLLLNANGLTAKSSLPFFVQCYSKLNR